jgi:hypothetical protein
VLAYAFLAKGAVEPLSGFDWPTPEEGDQGSWLDESTAPREALRGYPVGDLPYWLDEELWRIDLDGAVAERVHVFLAKRARLRSRVERWSEPLAWELVGACARRVARAAAVALREEGRAEAAARLEGARDLGEVERAGLAAAEHGSPAGRLAGYVADVCFYARDAGVAAHAAGVAAKMSAHALAGDARDAQRYDERLTQERAWQAAWLVDRLGL